MAKKFMYVCAGLLCLALAEPVNDFETLAS